MLSFLLLVVSCACLGGLVFGGNGDDGDQSTEDDSLPNTKDETVGDNLEVDISKLLQPDETLYEISGNRSLDISQCLDDEDNMNKQEGNITPKSPNSSNEPVVTGSEGSDQVWGGDSDQTLYHTGVAFKAQLEAPHHIQAYAQHTDSASDTLHGCDGNDTIFFGTGDQVFGGEGADVLYGFLDMPDDQVQTTLVDFKIAEDKLVIFLPQGLELQSVEQTEHGDQGRSITVLTAGGAFTFSFPWVTLDLEIEVIEERYDPEQHPILFLSQHASLSSNVFVVQNAGFA